MGRTWRGIRALSLAEWVALVQSVIAIPIVILSLKWFGLARTQRRLASLSEPRVRSITDPALARPYARIVTIAGSHGIVRPNCLQRSLVLWTLLRRRAMDPELRIGVAPPSGDEGLRFHAWIELSGEVMNDRPGVAEEFQPFESAVEAAPSAFDR